MTGYEAFKGKWALRHGRNTNSLLGSEAFDGDVLLTLVKKKEKKRESQDMRASCKEAECIGSEELGRKVRGLLPNK